MPVATLRYRLPDEQHDWDCARLGRDACDCLRDIDQRCRSLCKHGEPTPEERRLAEEVRQMIRQQCPEALDL